MNGVIIVNDWLECMYDWLKRKVAFVVLAIIEYGMNSSETFKG